MEINTYKDIKFQSTGFPIKLEKVEPNEAINQPMHWHSEIEILFCISGSGSVLCNDNSFTVSAGDIIFFNGNDLHSVYAIGCSFYSLFIGTSIIADLNLEEYYIKNKFSSPSISKYFHDIIKEIHEQPDYFQSNVKAMVTSIIINAYRNHRLLETIIPQKRNNKLNMLRNALIYIHRHCLEDITIEDISNYVGFSKFYFCRTFKEIMGYTVTNFINVQKCQHACCLLSSGKYNVTESALLSGFNNMSYFTKTYKSIMGVSPSADIASKTPKRPTRMMVGASLPD